jgi:hypothetical protein
VNHLVSPIHEHKSCVVRNDRSSDKYNDLGIEKGMIV